MLPVRMRRMGICLGPEVREWLARQARREHVSQAEVVRRALRLYREKVGAQAPHSFEKLARQSSGLRLGEDGMTAQLRLRNEWGEPIYEVPYGKEK